MEHKQVVIYARVSSREQEREGFSIPAQLKLLKEYALKQGFQIVNEYSDAETAKKAGRTNYNAMLEFLKANPHIKTVLVEKTDRLYRNFKDYVTLEDYDLEVHLVKESTVISKNSKSHDKFIHGIKVLMAKNYIDNLSEEISKGLKEAVEEGYWPFKPPYGYLRGAKKELIIDKSTILFIRRAFELFATGKYSIRQLCEHLFLEGYYYKADRPKITQCVLESILKNVFYVGQMNCNGIIYQGKHAPIVSRDLFDKVQLAFLKTSRSRVRKNFDFLYPGIAKCGICGYAFCGERQKGNVYYRCSHYDRSCPNTDYISETQLTQALRMHLKRIGLKPDILELVKLSLKMAVGDEQEYHKQEVERINSEIENCKEVLKKMYLDQVNNILEYDLWVNLKNDYEVKLSRLMAELQRHTRANTNFFDTGLKILDLCGRASLPATELSAQEVADIVRQTYLSVKITNKKVDVIFKQPYANIEELVKLAKQGIAELGHAQFKQKIISSYPQYLESTKKAPEGADFYGSICFKWWEVGEEILTNHAYDIYEMSPYLMEMKTWLNEIDSRKYTS